MIEGANATRLYCPDCGIFHPATLAERNGCVYWHVSCPKGERDVKISGDARLFAKFRAQARPVPPAFRKTLSNCVIHINDDCSLQCPICFEAASRRGWRMSAFELREAALRVKRANPVNVMLIGGEPTEHPQILEFLRILSGEFGFYCSMLTNGVRIGREPAFAAELKRAGLRKASISFDTFDPEVSRLMRGSGELVDVKLQAAENCFAAELNCGFVTTMCRVNLPELPKIVAYYIRHAGRMSMYEIQCYQESGRTVPGLQSVDREEIVRTLVASGVVPGLSEDDFRVSPSVPAAGFCIDPDCGGGLFWTVKDGRAVPLNRNFRFDEFLDALNRMKPGSRGWKWIKFAALAVRFLGWRFLGVLRNWNRSTSGASESLQLLSISSLMTPERLDCHRFGRCTNGVLTADGRFLSPCYYYGCLYDRERGERL